MNLVKLAKWTLFYVLQWAVLYAALAEAEKEEPVAWLRQDRPSVLFRPHLSIDGNQWCALYGDNLQDGVAGFGDSPEAAMRDFDQAWGKKLEAGR